MSTGSTTSTGCDTHDMVLLHRVFRRQFGQLPAIIQAVAEGDRDRAAVIAAHAGEQLDVLHHHHTNEDELLWPKLRERPQLDAELTDRMQAQHEQVAGIVGSVGGLLRSWSADGNRRDRERLAAEMQRLHAALSRHLDEEEERVLPIVAETLTRQEWAHLAKRGMAKIRPSRRLVFLGYILEDATPDERRAFLNHIPPPIRLAYRVIGRRKQAREIAVLRGPLA
ncbi:MAG: hemerythrin domain-containing protein [Actinomycetota bacterium]|nr:hemerythrin domain-containing protein [Actinomycetota bacterium]